MKARKINGFCHCLLSFMAYSMLFGIKDLIPNGGLNMWIFRFRIEDQVAGGQNLLTLTTRTNLTSVTVREKKTSLFLTSCTISLCFTCLT